MSLSASNVSSVGQVLVNGSGFTLYLFTPEKGGTPACTGSCAATWPPVISPSASAAAMAGSGLQASDLGTVKLADGKFEVTYFGWPLHTYTGDTAAGQANGQGFGGQWFAITTQGTMAGGTGSPSGGSSSSGSTSGGGGGWG